MKTFLPLLICIGLAANAHATLLLSDSFDSATSGLNDNLATRQAGTLATKDWIGAGSGTSTIDANQMKIVAGNTGDKERNVYLDLDLKTVSGLVDDGAFTVSFDMTAHANYSGFFIGSDGLAGRPVVASQADNDFQMVIKSETDSTVFDDLDTDDEDKFFTAPVGTGKKSWVFTFETADFNAATPYTASLTIDGSDYDLNAGDSGNSVSGAWDGGVQYIGFVSRDDAAQTYIDNFEVIAVPEPSSLALLGIVALAAALRFPRRRK